MQNVKFQELISLLEKELVRMHYKEITLQLHRKIWSKLLAYFESVNEDYFSIEVAMRNLDEKYDFFAKREKGGVEQYFQDIPSHNSNAR